MISLLPNQSETLVISLEWDEVLERLVAGTEQIPYRNFSTLTGWVKEDRFQLTLFVRRFNLFMPVINGTIDPTSSGCLLFLHYQLLPFSKLFISFWCIFLFLGGVVLTQEYNDYTYIAGAGILISVILLVAWGYFKLHLKTTRKVLLSLLE